MSRARILLSAAAAFLMSAVALSAAPDLATLRSQLAQATTDSDTLSRIELLRRILDVAPGDTASHRLLIQLWLSIRDYDMAEATLNAWTDAPPSLAALTRATIFRNRDENIPGAIAVLNAYLAKSPKDIDALNALIDDLQTTGDAKAQLKALNSLVALQRNGTNLIHRASAKFALGDYKGALADARTAQKLEPDAAAVKDAMPQFERADEALKALAPLSAAFAKNPNDVPKLIEAAWWRRYGGMNDFSLIDAETVLKLVPTSVIAKIDQARALSLLGKLHANDALLQQSIDVSKPHALETAQAILACDLALAKNPKDAAQLGQRALALIDAEQYLLARQDAEAAMAIDPTEIAAALADLHATEMLGNDPAPLYRRIEHMNPSNAQLAFAAADLADLYFRQSKFPLALDFADRSLALDETERALRIKGATLQRLGRTDDANAVIQRADAIHKE